MPPWFNDNPWTLDWLEDWAWWAQSPKYGVPWDVPSATPTPEKSVFDLPATPPPPKSDFPDLGLGGGGGASDKSKAKMFLLAEFAGIAAIAAAPVLYRAYKGQKGLKNAKKQAQADKIASSLDASSERMLGLLGKLGPYAAIPAAYITVQALEDAEYITRGVGNAVQTIMAGSVGTDLLGNIVRAVT